MSVALFDHDGYAIPFAAADEVIECGFDDPDYGDPADWPTWTDRDVWEDGPAVADDVELEPAGFEPSQEDIEFLNVPPGHDWEEYARIAEWQDRLEQDRRITDAD